MAKLSQTIANKILPALILFTLLTLSLSSCSDKGTSKALSTGTGTSASDAAGATTSLTNEQEKGVREADYSVVGTDHIFIRVKDAIQTIDRKSLDKLGTIPVTSTNSKIYSLTDKLVILSEGMWDGVYSGARNTVNVALYRSLPGEVPVHEKSIKFEGQLLDSRVRESHLILVFQDHYDPANFADRLESESPVRGITCGSIADPSVGFSSRAATRVVSLDLDNPASPPRALTLLGLSSHIYMTENHLYVASQQAGLLITKISLIGGVPEAIAAGKISGWVKDQWAFKEFAEEGVLLVATSTGATWNRNAKNHLWALKANEQGLAVVGSVHNYGLGEDIRAVRYVDKTAYVVTFKKTDPLYAFDVSTPAEPKMIGELKVPGFSTYLHPTNDKKLIGVGFDAEETGDFAWFQGIQISLFDVSDPTKMLRLDNKVIGQRGSYSDITGDHHAFFYDEETRLLGVPVVELLGGSGGSYGMELGFSGAILYSVGSEALNEQARISHKELMPPACEHELEQGGWWQDKTRSPDVHRIYKVDGRLLALSQYGLSAHSLEKPAEATKRVVLSTTCLEPRRQW